MRIRGVLLAGDLVLPAKSVIAFEGQPPVAVIAS